MTDSGSERRKHPRIREELFCPASFRYEGKQYTGYMVDFSREGAGFRIYGLDDELFIEEGVILSYEINTTFGVTRCKGKIAWFKRDGNGYTWGIVFESLPEKADDPLLRLIQIAS